MRGERRQGERREGTEGTEGTDGDGNGRGDDRQAIVEEKIMLTATELRIHEHTERGDNDTVKMPNGQKVVIDGKTCGS